jgi:hypothetical protein
MNIYILLKVQATGEGFFSEVVTTFANKTAIPDYVKKNLLNYKQDENSELTWHEVDCAGRLDKDSFLAVEEHTIEDL